MNSSEQILLRLIRESLFNIDAELPDSVDWDEVFQTAQDQAVLGLISSKYIKEVPSEWKSKWYQIVIFCERVLQAQQELVQLLAAHGIPSAILKGSAAAIYYPWPSLRTMGDVDIIVPQKFFDSEEELMKNSGYAVMESEETIYNRTTAFAKQGIIYELHHHFSYRDINIEPYIANGFSQIQTKEINGASFPMFDPVLNGLILLVHMRSHLKSGMGLRQMIDWMMYVDKVLDDKEWEEKFKKLAETLNLQTLAINAARMCQIFLGLSERITWCREADDSLCMRLMDMLLSTGNFGNKLGAGRGVEAVTSAFRRMGIIRYLQVRGEDHWEIYRNHRWLRPLCWIYQIGRYFRQGIAAKRGSKLFDDLHRSKERSDVLKKLHIKT